MEKVREARIVCPIHNMSDCSPLLNGCSRVIAAWAEVEEWEELIEAVDDVIDWHREHESVPSLYPLLQIMWRRREKLSEVAS